MSGKVHELKTEPVYFEATLRGDKPYEIRRDDRGFEVGDHLRLREYDREAEVYSGREVTVVVTHILDHPRYLPEGYVAMGIRPLDDNEGPDWLREQARVCHELATARGKYPPKWLLWNGHDAIESEIGEWLDAVKRGDSRGAQQEYGDVLHAVLSLGHHMGYDAAGELADAQERNRKRAEEGE